MIEVDLTDRIRIVDTSHVINARTFSHESKRSPRRRRRTPGTPGLREKLAAKAVANREAICAEARGKSETLKSASSPNAPGMQALLDAADRKQVDAQKAAEAAMLEWIRLREQFSNVHDSLTATNNAHDASAQKARRPGHLGFCQ